MLGFKDIKYDIPVCHEGHEDISEFSSFLYISLHISLQSAALPPLAAPAQTCKPTTANINGSATTAAAASALIHLGWALLVFLIQTLEKESGNQ